MAVRIQLSSNFQVIELTYENWESVCTDELDDATNLVNELGSKVKNDIKTTPKTQESKKEVEMATEGQIKFLVKLGIPEEFAKTMTKKEAWTKLQKLTKAIED